MAVLDIFEEQMTENDEKKSDQPPLTNFPAQVGLSDNSSEDSEEPKNADKSKLSLQSTKDDCWIHQLEGAAPTHVADEKAVETSSISFDASTPPQGRKMPRTPQVDSQAKTPPSPHPTSKEIMDDDHPKKSLESKTKDHSKAADNDNNEEPEFSDDEEEPDFSDSPTLPGRPPKRVHASIEHDPDPSDSPSSSAPLKKRAKESHERTQSKGNVGSRIPDKYEDLSRADKKLYDMREAGHKWPEIRTVYEKIIGTRTARSTLPNRFNRIKANIEDFDEEADELLLRSKTNVEDAFEREKWDMISKTMRKNGSKRKFTTEALKHRFAHLISHQKEGKAQKQEEKAPKQEETAQKGSDYEEEE